VGRTALLLSSPIMLVGFASTFMTFQDVYIWQRDLNPAVLLVYWPLYFALAPLLFLLPLAPLRELMGDSKTACLEALQRHYRSLDRSSVVSMRDGEFDDSEMGQQLELSDLFDRASQMSVWPLDRDTIARFAGMVVTPVLPLLLSEMPNILKNVVDFYLGG
jgi:hypothetical protein